MRILLTGTHFTVALATIEELKIYDGVEIVYVGRKTTQEGDPTPSSESQILPKLGVRFISITTGRLQRAFTLYTVPSLIKIPIGFIQAFFILINEAPDVILSFGGYVSVPIVILGWLFSIPIIIHEQTLVTGLSNRISGWFANKIAVSFKTNYDFSKDKVVLTGNPLRKEILNAKNIKKSEKLPVILITGGNQGSHTINIAVEEVLDKLTKIANVIHQTGDAKFMDFERLEDRQNESYQVAKWIPNMGDIMKKADLVVCRAGINTLTEVAFLGIPALVIPIPYLYQDEQNKNAKYFEKLGLVRILPQSKLNGEFFLKEINSCLNDLNHFKEQARKAREVIVPDAAKRLALETILLAI